MRQRQQGKRGFSLIEAMMVVVILGIVAGIAAPSISELVGKRTAQIEVEKVKAELERARDDARARLRCIRITNPTASSLKLDELAVSASGCGASVTSTITRQFNSNAVAMPNAIDVTFTRSGSLAGTGADPTFIVAEKRNGLVAEPHVFRIFRLLGLVRKQT